MGLECQVTMTLTAWPKSSGTRSLKPSRAGDGCQPGQDLLSQAQGLGRRKGFASVQVTVPGSFPPSSLGSLCRDFQSIAASPH